MSPGQRAEAITELLSVLEDEALRERAKHILQSIIAQEVNEVLHRTGADLLRNLIDDVLVEAQAKPNRISKEEVLNKVAADFTKQFKPTSWDQGEMKERVVKAIVGSAQMGAVFGEASAIIREDKPQLLARAYEEITKGAHQVLVSQVDYYRSQVEDLQRRLTNLETNSRFSGGPR